MSRLQKLYVMKQALGGQPRLCTGFLVCMSPELKESKMCTKWIAHLSTRVESASAQLLYLYWKLSRSCLNSQQERKSLLRSFNLLTPPRCCSAFQQRSQSLLLMAAARREPAAPSGSPAKRNVHPQGWLCVSVWIVVSEAVLPAETIKSTVTASGQNKEPFFSHNSATFGLSKSQKTRISDKENSAGYGWWRENKLRKSWFSLPDKPAAYLGQKTTKSFSTTHSHTAVLDVSTMCPASCQVLNICQSWCQLMLFKTKQGGKGGF